MFRRLWNSRSFILKKSFSVTALLYAILGFVRMFVALEGFFDDGTPFLHKLFISVLILLGVWSLCVLGTSIWVLFLKKKKVVQGRNGKSVFVTYGDLFSEKIVRKTDEMRSICFAVNRCFDTIINNQLIATASIHGIAMNRLYKSEAFTPESLNDAIQKAIPSSAKFEMLTSKDKPQGNLKRYEVGTIVDIPISDKLHYFMLGLSPLNKDLQAKTSMPDYCLAIQKMIEYCDAHAQGQPVLIPIIGAFLARTGQSEIDLLEYLIKCFELNRDKINQDIYIVIKESAKNTVSILDL